MSGWTVTLGRVDWRNCKYQIPARVKKKTRKQTDDELKVKLKNVRESTEKVWRKGAGSKSSAEWTGWRCGGSSKTHLEGGK